MEQKTDEEIALMIQDGDKELFGMLVERYEQKLLRYASKFLSRNSADAEDAVQESFLKAYANIQSFDAMRKFSPWIYRITHNQIINSLKKRGREPTVFFDYDTFFPSFASKDKTDDEINRKELKEMIDSCLNKLEQKYREPMVLYYIEEFNYKEIADIMHIPMSTVGIRLKRGKEAMKKIYDKTYGK